MREGERRRAKVAAARAGGSRAPPVAVVGGREIARLAVVVVVGGGGGAGGQAVGEPGPHAIGDGVGVIGRDVPIAARGAVLAPAPVEEREAQRHLRSTGGVADAAQRVCGRG